MLSRRTQCISTPSDMLYIWTYMWNDTEIISTNNKQEEIT